MAEFNEKDVLEKLKGIIDPELEVNIVDLGLVY
ncbi:MAG: iron-sulfur cluster assembly protein, partial [Deltaproteobacteria bacterium]|nr:iron-sulfur cluster assembly protein [Deltaproteobacteria bacterium]